MGEFRENIPSATESSLALNMNLSVMVIRNKIFFPADFSSKSRPTSILHGLGTNISVCNTFKGIYCINFIFFFLAFSCILHSLRVPGGRRKDRFGFLITLGSITCGTGLWFLVFAATAQMEITSPSFEPFSFSVSLFSPLAQTKVFELLAT